MHEFVHYWLVHARYYQIFSNEKTKKYHVIINENWMDLLSSKFIQPPVCLLRGLRIINKASLSGYKSKVLFILSFDANVQGVVVRQGDYEEYRRAANWTILVVFLGARGSIEKNSDSFAAIRAFNTDFLKIEHCYTFLSRESIQTIGKIRLR